METSEANSPFPPTRWTAIAAVRQLADSLLAQKALAGLCRDYWYPLYAFARRAGRDMHDAQDLTQGFFCRILETNLFGAAKQEKGRLRTFLLTAFKRYISDVRDKEQALKRGGGREIISLNLDEGEERYVREPADHVTPETLYERSWAMAVLRSALSDLGNQERKAGREKVYAALEGFLSPANTAAEDHAAASATLRISEEAVRQAVSRLRKKFRGCLRRQIADTLQSPTEHQIDEELASLGAALSQQ